MLRSTRRGVIGAVAASCVAFMVLSFGIAFGWSYWINPPCGAVFGYGMGSLVYWSWEWVTRKGEADPTRYAEGFRDALFLNARIVLRREEERKERLRHHHARALWEEHDHEHRYD